MVGLAWYAVPEPLPSSLSACFFSLKNIIGQGPKIINNYCFVTMAFLYYPWVSC